MIDIEKFDRQLNPRHKDYGKYKIADQKDAMKTLLADLYHELGAKKDTVQAIITPPYSKIAINDVAFKWTRRCVRRILPLESYYKEEVWKVDENDRDDIVALKKNFLALCLWIQSQVLHKEAQVLARNREGGHQQSDFLNRALVPAMKRILEAGFYTGDDRELELFFEEEYMEEKADDPERRSLFQSLFKVYSEETLAQLEWAHAAIGPAPNKSLPTASGSASFAATDAGDTASLRGSSSEVAVEPTDLSAKGCKGKRPMTHSSGGEDSASDDSHDGTIAELHELTVHRRKYLRGRNSRGGGGARSRDTSMELRKRNAVESAGSANELAIRPKEAFNDNSKGSVETIGSEDEETVRHLGDTGKNKLRSIGEQSGDEDDQIANEEDFQTLFSGNDI